MRKIKLFIASSLDGYIARKDESIDWLFSDGDYGYKKFYKSIDTVVMGRKTYDLARTFGPSPYKGKKCYVFSRSLTGEKDGIRFVDIPVASFAENLRRQKGKHIWLVGGGELAQAFLAKNLVDEIILSIHPILLGSGAPLFLPHSAEVQLLLVKCIEFDTGLVQLHYVKRPPSASRIAHSARKGADSSTAKPSD